ncbi:DUF2345 domain-containing protein, partial [Limnohabitans sp.]|uniref:DUF2345 domain-containing protein n=1 Tax=Limnohabitans sp. TaxID=1907725 RepID=UPI0037BE47E1
QQGHWKAALMWLQTARTGQGVNSEKGQFAVPASAPEEVVMATERLMQLGLGDAFYWMGQFHQSGDGVRPSEDRAWAFWELAANMGSPLAQTEIAKALGFVDRDQEKPNVAEWANQPLKLKLLECAHAQGYGEASYLLGGSLDRGAQVKRLQPRFPTPEAQYRYALQVLHDGVKFGSEAAAGYLSSSLRSGDPIALQGIDLVRADRYHELAKALWHNPDLRFPNLDRVIPLPPAKLPQWDSQPDSLIQAAQGLRATPGPAKTSVAPGRARVPVGYAVPAAANAQTPLLKGLQWNPREGSTIALAPREGYYQPVLQEQDRSSWPERLRNLPETYSDVRRREVLATAPPLHYRAGEPLSLATCGLLSLVSFFLDTARDHEGVRWRYLGPAQAHAPAQDHLARAGPPGPRRSGPRHRARHRHAISSGGHTSVSSGKSFLVSAKEAIHLFAHKADMRWTAGKQDAQFTHLMAIAKQEQKNVLQEICWNDPVLRGETANNAAVVWTWHKPD